MNTFSIVSASLAKTEDDPNKAGLDDFTVMAGRVIAAVQTVVDALTPPAGGRYVVGFADISTAGTQLADHRITVSSKPLRDPSLSLIEKAVVIATFTAHEIGHTYVTRPRKFPVNLVTEHNHHSGFHSVANVADDIILEPFMVERFPILADAFEFTAGWVLRTTMKTLPVIDVLNRKSTTADRFNIIMHATRYGDIADIIWSDPRACEERDWARDWKQRLLAVPLLDHTGFLAMCDEVWDRVRTVDETPEPEPEPPPPLGESPDGEGEPEPGEGEPEPGEGEGNPQPGTETDGESDEPALGNDFDEDTDEDGEGQPDGTDGEGEDGDEPGGDTGSGDSESDDSGDGEGESHGGDWDGEDDDSDHDGDDEGQGGDYTGHDGEGNPDGDQAGGGGNAEAESKPGDLRDEDDFDQDEVDETTHDSAEQSDPWGERVDALVRTYDATTVTSFGHHGHIATNWE